MGNGHIYLGFLFVLNLPVQYDMINFDNARLNGAVLSLQKLLESAAVKRWHKVSTHI